MEFKKTDFEGVWIIEPKRYGDARGYFCETFKQEEFDKAIGHVDFVQDNESVSRRGVLRGLHYQRGDAAQAKLVRVSQGTVLDVAVDLRRSSSTFGRYIMVELSAETGRQLFVPRGFAHGFIVVSETAQFQYKVDNRYRPDCEVSIRFDDAALAIDWRLPESERLLSPKDLQGINFEDAEKFD
jgi:dTDP-4-dehydrorhamnose 3,5-epimerase